MSKRGLGRGLGALIPETSAFSHGEGDAVLSIPIHEVEPNPDQPRHDFAEDQIERLADSIQRQGLLQPIIVRRVDDHRYQLVAGERRWRAAQRAGFEQVPAIQRETRDDEMLPLALVENVMRQDLDPIEEASAYRELGERMNWTQQEIAQRVGKGRVHVANTLRLLSLPESIQRDLVSGTLTRGHARALLACRDENEMRELHERIVSAGLTVREAEDHAQQSPASVSRKKKRRSSTARPVSPETRECEERLQRIYGTPVQIHDRAGRGRVSLEFYSYDDLNRLIDLLQAAEERGPNQL